MPRTGDAAPPPERGGGPSRCGTIAAVSKKDRGRDRQEGTIEMLVHDLVQKVGGTALLVGALVVFLAGAFAGLTMISRLGGAGWFMYVLVIGTWALVFGPAVAYGRGMHQKGSKAHRAEIERLRDEQRLKYGLPRVPVEDPPSRPREPRR